MMQMLKQARGLQKQMKQIQKKVEKRDVAATTAGGKIEVVCSGKLVIKRILVDQSLLDGPEKPEKRVFQDMLVTAVNAAIKKAQDIMNAEMARMAGDMGIPTDELTGGASDADDDHDDDKDTASEGGGRLKRWFKRS